MGVLCFPGSELPSETGPEEVDKEFHPETYSEPFMREAFCPNHTTSVRISQIPSQGPAPQWVVIQERPSSPRPQPCACAIK
jgi:hypothetical protein